MKKDWGNTYLLISLIVPIIFGIFVNWMSILFGYLLFGFILWFEGRDEKCTVDIGKKKYNKNFIIIYWLYFLFYRFYEVWKDSKLMNELSKTEEELINEKRYKTLKKIL